MTLDIGTMAPPFELIDQERNPVTNEDLKGQKSVVVFIPFPFSGICEGEVCAIRDRLAALNELRAKVIVITVDTHFTNQKWSDDNGFEFPVLSDYWPHGETAKAYGAFNDKVGTANRVSFILDENGVVRDVIDSGSLGTPREFDDYVAALEAIES
ncbi:MAG: peroxiredoxin [Acidimicrobiia bacterium]|nr:MAG: peroxiredoxin [Acidimicrobiia bacterium]